MKSKAKLLGWLIAVAAVAGIYLAAVSSLPGQMEETLSTACKRPVTIRSAQFILPSVIRLTGVEFPAMRGEDRAPLKIDAIHARLSASAWGQGQPVGELEVFHPQLYIEWTQQAKELSALGVSPLAAPSGAPVAQVKISGGELTFVDRLAVPNVYWNLRDASFAIRPGVRPQEREFALSGRLKDENGRDLGAVSAQGTHFPPGGLVDAVVRFSHGDLGKLASYLRRVFGTAPVRGAVEMETRLTLYEGTLMAHNDVTVSGVLFSDSQPTTLGPDGNRLVELLKDREGKIHLSFIVARKPGEKIDWSDLAAGAMREAMRQAMSRSIQQVLSDTEQQKPVEELLRKKLDSLDR